MHNAAYPQHIRGLQEPSKQTSKQAREAAGGEWQTVAAGGSGVAYHVPSSNNTPIATYPVVYQPTKDLSNNTFIQSQRNKQFIYTELPFKA